MPTIGQIQAAAYPAILNRGRGAANQWGSNGFLRELERIGAMKEEDFGDYIGVTLDYQENPDANWLATDNAPTSTNKTEVLTEAQFAIAQLSVPITWYRADDVKTPSVNAKINFNKSLIANGLTTSDTKLERAILGTTTEGFLGLQSLIPTSGLGNPGGIDATTEVWWRNHNDTYLADGSDIEAVFTEAWNTAAKSSGDDMAPSAMVSGAEAHALYEGQLQSIVRLEDTKEANIGFRVIAFKNCRYVFSQFGDDKVYFYNPKTYRVLLKSKGNFRDLEETINHISGHGYTRRIYSACQAVIDNKSRLAVVSEAV